MAANALEVDSAGERLKSSSRRVVEVEGEVNRLGVRAIEVERRGVAGATPAAALLTLLGSTCPRARRKKKEDVQEASRRVNG